MKKNVQNQVVGAQLVSKTDGSAVTTGTTQVYVTGDNGTQATSSPGVAVHKGNGYWEFAPDQSETNYDHVAFTFVNSSAINATVQVWTSFPQTGDNYARIGAPAGASISADVAAVKAVLPSALVSGRIDASVGAYQSGLTPLQPTTAGRTLDVTATGEAGIDWSNIGAPTTTVNLSGTTISAVSGAVGSVTGAVGSVTGNVGGNVTGSVGSVSGAVGSVTARVTANTDQLAGQTVTAAAGVTFPTSVASPTNITAGTITTVTNLTNAPTNGDLTSTMKTSVTTAATAATPTAAAVTGSVGSVVGFTPSDVTAVKTVTDKLGDTLEADSSPANYRFTTHALANAPTGGSAPTAAAVASAVRTELTPELAEIPLIKTVTDKVGDMVEADSSPANYRLTAHALAQAPTASVNLADLLDEPIAGHTTTGSVGEKINSAASAGNPWTTTLEGAFTAEDFIRMIGAVVLGKATFTAVGDTGETFVFRDITDSTDIVSGQTTTTGRSVTLAP